MDKNLGESILGLLALITTLQLDLVQPSLEQDLYQITFLWIKLKDGPEITNLTSGLYNSFKKDKELA